jgi:hypothetical protein
MLRRFALSHDFIAEQRAEGGPQVADLLTTLPEASLGVLRRIRDAAPSAYQKTVEKLRSGKTSHRQLLAEYERLLQQNDLIPARVEGKRAPNRFAAACRSIATSHDQRLGLNHEDTILSFEKNHVPICADIVIWQPSQQKIIAIECKYIENKSRSTDKLSDMLAHAALGASFCDVYWLFFPKNSEIISAFASVLNDIGLANVGLVEIDVRNVPPGLSVKRAPEAKQPFNAREWFAGVLNAGTKHKVSP